MIKSRGAMNDNDLLYKIFSKIDCIYIPVHKQQTALQPQPREDQPKLMKL